MKKELLELGFGFLGYIILIIPMILGFFTYPMWLAILCGIVSGFWVGPWLFKRYIAFKLNKNNPLRKK